MAQVTLKALLQEARDLVNEKWVKRAFYLAEIEDPLEDEVGGLALDPKYHDKVTGVCALGALRLAFAKTVGTPMRQFEWYEGYGDDVQYVTVPDEGALMEHPFYGEALKTLGEGFYKTEASGRLIAAADREQLMDGREGRPYTLNDVGSQVVQINDSYDSGLNDILAAFDKALELAEASDITTEKLPEATAAGEGQ